MAKGYPKVHARAHEEAAALVGALARPGDWVLDCGAGDLSMSRVLAARGVRVLAIDPHPAPGILRASWEGLPVRNGSLAAITACASLHYASDLVSALPAAARALRSGGRLIAALSPVHRTAEGAHKGELTARRRFNDPSYRHLSLREVEDAFRVAGLDLEVRPFLLGGWLGLLRRVKSALGVEQAEFPILIGTKP